MISLAILTSMTAKGHFILQVVSVSSHRASFIQNLSSRLMFRITLSFRKDQKLQSMHRLSPVSLLPFPWCHRCNIEIYRQKLTENHKLHLFHSSGNKRNCSVLVQLYGTQHLPASYSLLSSLKFLSQSQWKCHMSVMNIKFDDMYQ